MDELEEDSRLYRQSYGSSHRPKLPVRNPSYVEPIGTEFGDEDVDDEDERYEEEVEIEVEEEVEVEVEEEEEGENGIERVVDVNDDDDEDEEDDGNRTIEPEEKDLGERHRKRRKLKSVNLGYEFAPRVAAVPSASAVAPKPPSFGGRNLPADWTEQATFVLLDTWGDKFVQLGRKSLRSEEWHEVAKQVAQASRVTRTDTQCRNRLDTLKKKYKKEKMRLSESPNATSKWVYFKKMDMLMTSSLPAQQRGLPCGVDSGEFVFSNPKVYLSHSNVLDEMRDSPGNSESSEGDGDGDQSDGLPPKKSRPQENGGDKSSVRCLTDSIEKFGQIYEKIENKKRDQMVELEKMRMEFYRDLEIKKRQIMERAHAELAKIRRGDDDEVDGSMENLSD
ncbi:hypothetical protein GIB67_035425 [Kingdonia uniflora]|uniref:Myb/SANT-like DNA-binding domain-containing protein n=1 Tax=Kingdonia uniflora TaxID=39325 RepID=A0A7J7P0C8_9MAGN|nr:hypothetical protein GIB67_035425 [Kingdonia uniflora]